MLNRITAGCTNFP